MPGAPAAGCRGSAQMLLLLLLSACIHAKVIMDQHTDDSHTIRTVLSSDGIVQHFQPHQDGLLTTVNLKLGSMEPCREFSAELIVFEALADTLEEPAPVTKAWQPSNREATRRILHRQPVQSTCSACELSADTCLMTPACSRTACLAWQGFQLDAAITVLHNQTYGFQLQNFASPLGGLPAVGVSLASENHGGWSNLPINTRLLNTPTQYTFRAFLDVSDAQNEAALHAGPTTEGPNSGPSVDQTDPTVAVVVAVLLSLVVLLALVVVLVARRARTKARVALDNYQPKPCDLDPDFDTRSQASSVLAWRAPVSVTASSTPLSARRIESTPADCASLHDGAALPLYTSIRHLIDQGHADNVSHSADTISYTSIPAATSFLAHPSRQPAEYPARQVVVAPSDTSSIEGKEDVVSLEHVSILPAQSSWSSTPMAWGTTPQSHVLPHVLSLVEDIDDEHDDPDAAEKLFGRLTLSEV